MGLKKGIRCKIYWKKIPGCKGIFTGISAADSATMITGFRPAAGSSCWEKPCLLTHFYCNKHGAENQNNDANANILQR